MCFPLLLMSKAINTMPNSSDYECRLLFCRSLGLFISGSLIWQFLYRIVHMFIAVWSETQCAMFWVDIISKRSFFPFPWGPDHALWFCIKQEELDFQCLSYENPHIQGILFECLRWEQAVKVLIQVLLLLWL